MFDSLLEGARLIFQLKPFLYMLVGIAIGFWVGILPGIGGSATLAIMLPFIYKMSPQEGIPFLLGMHSVIQTTGDITSVLFGIPGEPTTAATIMDGYPMARKGEAGRALGGALANLITVGVGLLFINHLARLTMVRGSLLIPAILFLCFLGAYGTENRLGDLVLMVGAGVVGYCMLRGGLPRPAFLIGLILGEQAETYLAISNQAYGYSWLLRPGVLEWLHQNPNLGS